MILKSKRKNFFGGGTLSKKMDDAHSEPAQRARRIALQQLHSLQHLGLVTLPQAPRTTHFPALKLPGSAQESAPNQQNETATVAPTEERPPAKPMDRTSEAAALTTDPTGQPTDSGVSCYSTPNLPHADRRAQLEIVKHEVSLCTRCDELASCRQNTVFGTGTASPRLCFLGEGPGADEDRVGEPFVGAAGKLLTKIIEACQLKRADVYILNTVKCRPPGNRNPSESELDNCWPFAVRQLEILQPEFICCLGSVAARTLLQTKQSIGRLRGQFFRYRGSQVSVTYHPAYLLRNPSAKRQVWDDMKMLLAAMGQPL